MSDTGAASRAAVLLVAGFLGAGKTSIVRALTAEAPGADAAASPFGERPASPGGTQGPGPSVIEASPFLVPGSGPDGQVTVTAVDAINAAENLADPALRDLVAGQIRAADLIVLTCGDVADPAPARKAVAGLTGAPVIEAHTEADIAGAILGRAVRRSGPDRRPADHGAAFTVWTYSGPAVLTKAAMTGFVSRRPKGAYRVRGKVRLTEDGGRVDIFGRARRTSVIDRPGATTLAVAGPASRLSARELELAFAEAVTDAAYGRGVIACR